MAGRRGLPATRWSDADHVVGCDEHALEVYKRHVIHTDYKEIVEACKGLGCDEKASRKSRTREQGTNCKICRV